MSVWYDATTPPEGEWWWAVEHRGHPAFYLRALMPGDFAPGRAPSPRHVLTLGGEAAPAETRCGTCDEVPVSGVTVIERRTGAVGFLERYRDGRAEWPHATDEAACWLCGAPPEETSARAPVRGREVGVCAPCAAHVKREGG